MTAISQAYEYLMDGNPITGKIIGALVDENAARHEKQISLYERYKGSKDGVPILNRSFPIANQSKVNNRLANDFFSDIVNTKVGYFAGRPITYKYVTRNAEGETTSAVYADDLLNGLIKKNHMADLDTETAKMAAITGMAGRLCYNDLDGEGRIINVPPWECIFISDEIGITEAPYAIRYYQVQIGDQKYTRAEFYDDTEVSFWVRQDTGNTQDTSAFIPDPDNETVPHLMGGCPLICFPNNEELLGDCEKVLSLIDGYDKTLSDVNSEIEQFRLAYLAFYGMAPSIEQLEALRQTGVIGFPQTEDRAEYITKNLNDQIIENHLNRLDENIIYFAQSVRFTDESFGQASGVAMKFKLFCLESKCIIAERKFIKALYRQFAVLADYFAKKGITIDPWSFEFTFVRNFPLNLLDEAQSLAQLRGNVSDLTALSQMSFVEDPEKEIERMKAEQDEFAKAQAELAAAAAAMAPPNPREEPEPAQERP